MGHLRQRNKGSWQICIYQGYDAAGKSIRYHETVKGPKDAAIKRMRELEYGLDRGVPIPTGDLTDAEHLQNWLDGYV